MATGGHSVCRVVLCWKICQHSPRAFRRNRFPPRRWFDKLLRPSRRRSARYTGAPPGASREFNNILTCLFRGGRANDVLRSTVCNFFFCFVFLFILFWLNSVSDTPLYTYVRDAHRKSGSRGLNRSNRAAASANGSASNVSFESFPPRGRIRTFFKVRRMFGGAHSRI